MHFVPDNNRHYWVYSDTWRGHVHESVFISRRLCSSRSLLGCLPIVYKCVQVSENMRVTIYEPIGAQRWRWSGGPKSFSLLNSLRHDWCFVTSIVKRRHKRLNIIAMGILPGCCQFKLSQSSQHSQHRTANNEPHWSYFSICSCLLVNQLSTDVWSLTSLTKRQIQRIKTSRFVVGLLPFTYGRLHQRRWTNRRFSRRWCNRPSVFKMCGYFPFPFKLNKTFGATYWYSRTLVWVIAQYAANSSGVMT